MKGNGKYTGYRKGIEAEMAGIKCTCVHIERRIFSFHLRRGVRPMDSCAKTNEREITEEARFAKGYTLGATLILTSRGEGPLSVTTMDTLCSL